MELVLCFVIITISGVIRESSALLLRSPTSNDVFGELVASAERAQPLATRLTKRISRLNFNDREDDFWEDHGDASWNNSYTLVNGRTTLGSENRRRPASHSLIERPYYRDGRLSPVLGVQERRGRSVHSYHEEPVSFFDQRAFDEYTFRRRSQLHRQRARAGLRSRIKQNVRRLWRSARGAVGGWGRRVRRKIGDLFVGHLMPQLRRLRFWDQGLPPVVPPLIGNEPGQASVALVAERMEAGLREKALTEKNPTEAQQAVGTYLINSAENTWFISSPGGRYILLKKRGFLGGGGFGLVYHVEHPTTGQPFALKIFVQRVMNNEVAGIVIRSSASSLDFASCHDIPEQFREMIVGFLRKTPGVRLSPQQALEQFSLLNWKGPSPASDTASESEPVSTEEAALLQKE